MDAGVTALDDYNGVDDGGSACCCCDASSSTKPRGEERQRHRDGCASRRQRSSRNRTAPVALTVSAMFVVLGALSWRSDVQVLVVPTNPPIGGGGGKEKGGFETRVESISGTASGAGTESSTPPSLPELPPNSRISLQEAVDAYEVVAGNSNSNTTNPRRAYWMSRVTFMVLGAQKAGSSSLYYYMSQHPLLRTKLKETHCYEGRWNSSDPMCERYYRMDNDDEDYGDGVGRGDAGDNCTSASMSAARGAAASHPVDIDAGKDNSGEYIVGDFTPIYLLLSDRISDLVAEQYPWLKLVAVLREPGSRAYSQYQMRYRFREHTVTFEEAILGDLERLRDCGMLPHLRFREEGGADGGAVAATTTNAATTTTLDGADEQRRRLATTTTNMSSEIQRWIEASSPTPANRRQFDRWFGSERMVQAWKLYVSRHSRSRTTYVSRGLYAVHIHRWMSVFPHERFMAVKSSHLTEPERLQRVLDRIFGFLEIPSRTVEDLEKQKHKHEYDPMSSEASTLLRQIFEPFDDMLSKLLVDNNEGDISNWEGPDYYN